MKALVPLAWLYGSGVWLRNAYYDRAAPKKLPVPVVSVGNLSVGGSGKSPLVAAIARELLSKNVPVAVVSRGYGRDGDEPFVLVSDGTSVLVDARRGGDEPVELATRVSGLVVAVGADRYRVGSELISRLGPHVLLLDDGFQHRRLARDVDLVCVDCTEPPSARALLPAGRLREPLASLKRADAVVLTQWSDACDAPELFGRPVIRSQPYVTGFTRLDVRGEVLTPEELDGRPVSLLVGVARPERVRAGLRAELVHEVVRRDHYRWSEDELPKILERAKAGGATAVLTTGKDAVKMTLPPLSPLPVYRIDMTSRILDLERLHALLAFPPL